ncbi:MAG: ATPase, T2SS/T4P/T4SS family [Polyangiales bacterium]
MTFGIKVAIAREGGEWQALELPPAASVVIGRDDGCDVVLPSQDISRVHVTIHADSDGLRIVDTSVNGTRVGDQILRSMELRVTDETEIVIGPYSVRLGLAGCESRRTADGCDPSTPAFRRMLHQALLDHLDLASFDQAGMGDEIMRPKVTDALEQLLGKLWVETPEAFDKASLIAEMVDEVLGLGPLQSLLHDDQVSEIMVVDPETIYVERHGQITRTLLRFTDEESCRAVIERIVTPLGRRIDESTPMVDARLPDGSRVNAVIPPLAVRGPCITIRKFPARALEMSDLVSVGSLTSEMAEFLASCVRARKNLLISGGTGSGKTTLLNVLSRAIPSQERVVTIEDAAELRMQQPHVVSLEAKPSNAEGTGGYSIRDLVKNALRMRPDRIVVGECRGGEAFDMLQAMNTGHEGSMTTTHANSTREALARVQTLCMMSGFDLSPRFIRQQVSASIDIVIQQARFPDGTRRITEIVEVDSLDSSEEHVLRDIFTFKRLSGSDTEQVESGHVASGYVPGFVERVIESASREGARRR